jgi:hypothetical protein
MNYHVALAFIAFSLTLLICAMTGPIDQEVYRRWDNVNGEAKFRAMQAAHERAVREGNK